MHICDDSGRPVTNAVALTLNKRPSLKISSSFAIDHCAGCIDVKLFLQTSLQLASADLTIFIHLSIDERHCSRTKFPTVNPLCLRLANSIKATSDATCHTEPIARSRN